MKIFSQILISTTILFSIGCSSSGKTTAPVKNEDAELASGKEVLKKMAGCFMVDYNYVEYEGIKKGYKKDNRIYDVNKTKNVKEWISIDEMSPTRMRLEHILFFTDAQGKMMKGHELKHQTEDWQYSADFLYDYKGNSTWTPEKIENKKTWLRRVTNLDEGLRYQCAAAWNTQTHPADWTCDNYSPIPGRETRDMGRKDYQTLQRSTRLMVYGDSWLERQQNVKTIHEGEQRTPLAKEAGKNWYIRVPDSDCNDIKAYSQPRKNFWALLRDTWDDVLESPQEFKEKKIKDAPPRFAKITEVEKKYLSQNLADPVIYQKARAEVMDIINQYKETTK